MIKEKWKNIAFIIPAVAYIAALSFYPSGYAVYGSFQTRITTFTFVNYNEIAALHLSQSIYNTVVVTLLALGFQFFLGFAIATILTKEFGGKKFFSVLFLLPFGVATVVAGFVFSHIFTTNAGGYANSILALFGFSKVNWVTHFWNGVLSLVVADSWKNTPIVALILLAGMNSISPDIYHQAVIDGAGPASRFFRITLPNLGGYIAIALIIRGVSEFNIFAMALLIFHFQLLTTITYSLYSSGGTVYEAYAAATVLLAFILVFTGIILYNRNRSFKVQNGLQRKKNWFEKFRWFYTSDGYLVVAGRTRGNDSGILRHMSKEYIQIGSDAISVSNAYIDYEGLRNPSSYSLKEAAQFVLSFTDHWNDQGSEKKMFWKLNGSQEMNYMEVSATALELAISEVSGESLPMIAPKGTKRVTSGLVALVEPAKEGSQEKNESGQNKKTEDSPGIALEISRSLRIRFKEVKKLLPDGKLEISDISNANTARVLLGKHPGEA